MAAGAVPARPAEPSPRRCAPSRPASWWCRGRYRPRAGAGAAPATGPARRSGTAPSELLVGFFGQPVEEHQLAHQGLGALKVLFGIDLLGNLPLYLFSFSIQFTNNRIQILRF